MEIIKGINRPIVWTWQVGFVSHKAKKSLCFGLLNEPSCHVKEGHLFIQLHCDNQLILNFNKCDIEH